MKIGNKNILAVLLSAALFCSCQKDWLDAKPVQSLAVPATLKDFQALLDNVTKMNTNEPYFGEASCDDYYLKDADYNSRSALLQNLYRWGAGNIFLGGGRVGDWDDTYTQVYYANVVLDGMDKIDIVASNQASWNNVKGSALFYRAYAFFNLAQLFCKPYLPSSAKSDPGIVLRTDYDVNIPPVRSSIQETYDRILSDLLAAKDLLPVSPLYKTRPSKPGAFAMLARTYLSMGDYANARLFSDSALQLYNKLWDFNSFSTTVTNVFPTNPNDNIEIIFYSRMTSASMTAQNSGGLGYVDTTLYGLYAANDLRKSIYFKTVGTRLSFAGTYNGVGAFLFSGLASDEMYLTRAECNARLNNASQAMQDLNTLLVKRWKGATFVALTAVDADDALRKVLTERRKELCFRALRWTDLRRLNPDPAFAITLKRITGGQTYTLAPGDNRYVLPIPDNETLYSNILQNPR
jgi:tetratricopeptide (TPR) repeat protein